MVLVVIAVGAETRCTASNYDETTTSEVNDYPKTVTCSASRDVVPEGVVAAVAATQEKGD